MGNTNSENLKVGEITFGNSNILPNVVKHLLKILVDKNVISNADADKIIAESLNNQQEGIEAFEVEKSNEKFKDSREILLEQAGAFKDDETLDELLEFIYKERGRSMTE